MKSQVFRKMVLIAALVVILSSTALGADRTTVVYWQHFAESRVAAVQQLIQEFELENPDIRIEFEVIPWAAYFDKIFTSLAAGTGPDVFQVPVGLADRFINSGQIVPLNLSETAIQHVTEEYLPWTVERLQHDGKLWGLPTDIQTIVLLYNKRMFRDVGLDPDIGPADWDELVDYAKKLTRRVGDTIIQAGLLTNYYSITLETLMFQTGTPPMYNEDGTKALFNNPQGRKALQFLTDFTVVHRVEDPEINGVDNAFALEQGAMTYAHPVSIGTVQMLNPGLELGAAFAPPVRAEDTPVTVGTHWQYFISKKAHQDAAQRWVEFLSSERAQRVFAEVAADLVSRKNLLTSDDLRTDPNRAVALDSLQYAQPISWRGWAEYVSLYSEAIERVIYGTATVEESMIMLENAVNDLLAQQR